MGGGIGYLNRRYGLSIDNLLSADLSRADAIFVFLWPGLMAKLRGKVLAEMRPGSLIVSYEHRFPEWEPEKRDEKLHVFLYRVPERALRP